MKRGESGWRQSLLFSLNHIKMVFVCRSHSCVDVWLRPLLRHALTWWAVMTMSVTHTWWVTGKWGILKLHLSIHSAAPLGVWGQPQEPARSQWFCMETPWASIPLAFELLWRTALNCRKSCKTRKPGEVILDHIALERYFCANWT